jgi:PKD repeat protein
MKYSLKYVALFKLVSLAFIATSQTITNKDESIFVSPSTTIFVSNGGYTSENNAQLSLTDPTSMLKISGNLVNNGLLNLVNVANSTGVIEMNGTAAVSGTATPFSIPNLIVSGDVSLSRDIAVSGNLALNNNLNLINATINLTSLSNIVGETETKRIFTSGTGKIIYPIGSVPSLASPLAGIGLRLEGTISMGDIITRGHEMQTNAGDGSINRYFKVKINSSGKIISKLRFYYFDSEIPSTINEASLGAYISLDNGTSWQKYGGSLDTSLNYVEVTGLSISSDLLITLSNKNCLLPPVVNLGPSSQDFCDGSSITLDAGNSGIGAVYSWSNAETTQRISTSTPGLYSVTVRNSKGCEGSASATLVQRPKPVANFSTSISCESQATLFTNTTTIDSGTLTYTWNFGALSSPSDNSTSVNPSYSYPTAGDYTAVLTAMSATYNCSTSISKTVTVFPLPKVDFFVSNACLGQSTSFTNNSTVSTGGMVYDWDFGDGTTSTLASPTKSYASVNPFTVILTATSNANCISTISKTINIHYTPVADFQVSNLCQKITVPFINNSTIAAGSLTYAWNFGDATASTDAVPQKVYQNSGNYSISLVATSEFDCSNQISKAIDIYANPTANFEVLNDCQDKELKFANTSTSTQGTLFYDWDFGDGSKSSTTNPSNLYALPGSYSVVLKSITSFGCESTLTKEVTVFPLPQVNFDVSNACQDVAFNFNNTSTISSGTMSYQWEFGDATTSSSANPSKNYLVDGTYSIHLMALSDKGCTSEITKQLQVFPLPILNFGGNIITCGISYTLDAENLGSTYLWSDGSTNRLFTAGASGTYTVTVKTVNSCVKTEAVSITLNGVVTPNLGADITVCGSTTLDAGYPGSTYLWSTGAVDRILLVTSSGNYSVTVTDANGCVGSDNVIVTVNSVPIVNLGADVAICSDQSIILDAQNEGSAYLWSDNSTTKRIEPKASGKYSVVVTNVFGCTATDDVNVTINPIPINTLPAAQIVCDKVTLDAGNVGSSYTWSTTATTQKINVTASGTYSVTIVTSQNCAKQFSANITVNTSPLANLGEDRSLCFGESILLDAGNVGDSYRWQDNSSSKTLNANASGIYWVDVIRTNGCTKRDSVLVSIFPRIVNGLKKEYQICVNSPRVLDATSSQATSYQWFSKDGFVSNSPLISVTNPNRYWVISKNSINCTSTDSVKVSTDIDPITARYLVASFANVGDSVRFVQLSYPDPISFDWNFADGITSKRSDPVHRYLRTGDFNSLLTVSDPNDCSDSKSKIITIRLLKESGEENLPMPFLEWTKSNLFPNPSNDFFFLELEFDRQTSAQIILYSLDGKIMASEQIQGQAKLVELDVRHLSPGVYVLKILVNKESREIRMIKI